MGKNKKNKKRINIVYSTNPDFEYQNDNGQDEETIDPSEQLLEVWLDKKGRNGKTAILIKGFIGSEDDLKELGKKLKVSCGVGGSAKEGEIVIQGDLRDKIIKLLQDWGYKTKRVGG